MKAELGGKVKAIATALGAVDRATLAARFDARALTQADIYPSIWSRPGEEAQNRDYLLETFETVRDFVAGAADAGEALLVYIN